jgi:hypothetical protein
VVTPPSPSSRGACTCQPAWPLRQAHQSEASELLALAARLGEREPQAWAARVLAAAHTRSIGSGDGVLRVARLVALAQGHAPGVTELQAMARAAETSPAAAARPPLRSTPQAQADFNRPAHWTLGANGLLAPDASRMRGGAARAWSEITGKFGPELARRMFDANVRGGAMAVFAVLDAAGSALSVTVSDLARLQFAAIADGMPALTGVAAPDMPTLHDAAHAASAYGVSVQQEIHGDLFSEALLEMLFAYPRQIAVDASRPLGAQLQTVSRVRQAIGQQFASLSFNLLLQELDLAFFKPGSVDRQLNLAWSGDARSNAALAEQVLDANGLLAHLDTEGREAVRHLIYGADNPASFESIAVALARSGDRQAFARDLDAWLDDVAQTLREQSPEALMSRAAFDQRAAHAIAFGLVIERAAPGTLFMGLLDVPADEARFMPAARTLDLRGEYLAVLGEVQSALGIAP